MLALTTDLAAVPAFRQTVSHLPPPSTSAEVDGTPSHPGNETLPPTPPIPAKVGVNLSHPGGETPPPPRVRVPRPLPPTPSESEESVEEDGDDITAPDRPAPPGRGYIPRPHNLHFLPLVHPHHKDDESVVLPRLPLQELPPPPPTDTLPGSPPRPQDSPPQGPPPRSFNVPTMTSDPLPRPLLGHSPLSPPHSLAATVHHPPPQSPAHEHKPHPDENMGHPVPKLRISVH